MKKINLPNYVIKDCMKNSAVFREYIIVLLNGEDFSMLKAKVWEVVNQHAFNKIGAIKALREQFVGKTLDIVKAYPTLGLGQSIHYTSDSVLGLADSKKLVEHLGTF